MDTRATRRALWEQLDAIAGMIGRRADRVGETSDHDLIRIGAQPVEECDRIGCETCWGCGYEARADGLVLPPIPWTALKLPRFGRSLTQQKNLIGRAHLAGLIVRVPCRDCNGTGRQVSAPAQARRAA